MKLKYLIASFLLCILTQLNAQDTWRVDPSHSSIRFTVEHLVISEVVGSFSEFSGKMVMTEDDFSTAKVTGEINVSSIDTGNKQRDGHLLQSDFFDASTYPKITFESTNIKAEKGSYVIAGLLTMKGVEQKVELKAEYKGQVQFMGHTKAGIKATTTINRFDYGLNWNSLLETGGAVVGEEIDIVLNFELIRI
ncbi:MAG: YceI family protein [Ekhidna sp.]